MKLMQNFATIAGLGLLALAGGCMRGGISTSPPVHLVQDMDFQPKLHTQGETHFAGWSDGRAMRLPIADSFGKTIVVSRDPLPEAKYSNRDANKQFVKSNPLPVSAEVLARGRERFDITCAVCHGYSGQGGYGKDAHGAVGVNWPVLIPNFHFVEGKDNRVPMLPDGEVFEYITFGKGTMPAYGARITVEDRWAIVHYLRALQTLSK